MRRFWLSPWEHDLYQEAWAGIFLGFFLIILINLMVLPAYVSKHAATRERLWLGVIGGIVLGVIIAIGCELSAAWMVHRTGRWWDHVVVASQWGLVIGMIFAIFGVYSPYHPVEALKKRAGLRKRSDRRNKTGGRL